MNEALVGLEVYYVHLHTDKAASTLSVGNARIMRAVNEVLSCRGTRRAAAAVGGCGQWPVHQYAPQEDAPGTSSQHKRVMNTHQRFGFQSR